MQKLSKREKGLLYVLLLVAIVVGGIYLLILPAVDNYDATYAVVEDLRGLVMATRLKIETIPQTETQITEYQTGLAGLEGRLYPRMTSDQADNLVTTMLRQHRLDPTGITLGEAELTQLTPFGQEAAESASQPQVYRSQVSVQCLGNIDDFLRFANTVKGQVGLSITSLTASPQEGEGAFGFSLELDIYME